MADIHSSAHFERIGPDHPLREPTLRLILARDARRTAEADRLVADYLDTVGRQGVELAVVMAAAVAGRVLAGALVLTTPGRTGMLIHGVDETAGAADGLLADLVGGAKTAALERGLVVVQALLETDSPEDAKAFRRAGFDYLTELVYLDHRLGPVSDGSPHESGVRWVTYAPETEPLFIRALESSYDGSMDCPELAGARDPSDVLRGHRHTGFHDPSMWYLALVRDEPVGLVLLSTVGRGVLELVYLGVVRSWRGRGVGDLLVRTALDAARLRRARSLALAVDVRNTPARGLYRRWGFYETGRRRAWIATRGQKEASA